MGKVITLRIDDRLFEIIRKLAREMGVTKSEWIRNVIVYYLMGLFTGEFHSSFIELREKFIKYMNGEKE